MPWALVRTNATFADNTVTRSEGAGLLCDHFTADIITNNRCGGAGVAFLCCVALTTANYTTRVPTPQGGSMR